MKGHLLGRLYHHDEVICQEGDRGDSMYVIQSGSVRITKKTSSGDMKIADLGQGDIFGEMALFDRLPRAATARASGDTWILSVDKKKLFALISEDPTIVFRIIESMSRRIRKLDEEVTSLKNRKPHVTGTDGDVEEV